MGDDWKASYKKALLAAFATHASAIREGGFGYGTFEDYDRSYELHVHLAQCEVDVTRSNDPVDSDWVEWVSTEYGSETLHGLDARISCVCGYVSDEPMRWRATFGELMHAVLEETE